MRLDPSTSVHLHSGKALEKHSLVANVFVMDWLSQALAHPFRRYSFLALQSTIVPKGAQTLEQERNRIQPFTIQAPPLKAKKIVTFSYRAEWADTGCIREMQKGCE